MTARKKLLIVLAIFTVTTSTYAASKEKLVLMPTQANGIDKNETESIAKGLTETLSAKYEVVGGEGIAPKVAEIFAKESRKNDRCDADYCLREIAQTYGSSILAAVNVIKLKSGYHLTLKVSDVMEDRLIYNESKHCSGCGATEALSTLKIMAREAIEK